MRKAKFTLEYTPPKKLKRPFRKGDEVEICDRDLTTISTHQVVYAGKKVVRTDCGRRWDAANGWWLSPDSFACPFPSIRLKDGE